MNESREFTLTKRTPVQQAGLGPFARKAKDSARVTTKILIDFLDFRHDRLLIA